MGNGRSPRPLLYLCGDIRRDELPRALEEVSAALAAPVALSPLLSFLIPVLIDPLRTASLWRSSRSTKLLPRLRSLKI